LRRKAPGSVWARGSEARDPVRVALKQVPKRRWMMDRGDRPWHSTMSFIAKPSETNGAMSSTGADVAESSERYEIARIQNALSNFRESLRQFAIGDHFPIPCK
jgi:hypothetical protein